MNITRLNEFIRNTYNVADVKEGFNYWYFKLFNIILDMFKYDNLPSGLTARDIEINLIISGHAVIIAKNNGELFVPHTNIFGYDEYYQPTYAVFANPVVQSSKQWKIGTDCEIIYNNSLKDSILYIKSDSGLHTFISRYARQLSDIEATINIYTVNSRLVSIPVANDDATKQSLIQFFKNLVVGKRAIVTDSSIIENFRNIDINRTSIRDGVNDWIIARDKIIEQFYRDLGVRMNNPKKAQVTEEEVEANDQMLLISTDDMLKSRIEGIEKVNYMYGTEIRVSLNEKFDVKKGGENNENRNTREVSNNE